MAYLLPFEKVGPNAEVKPVASIIWMHGLGADGHDFVPFIKHLDLHTQGVRFVLPHAPSMPVTVNGGMPMPAWYDIITADFFAADGGEKAREDQDGIRYSQVQIERLIQHEVDSGIAASHIFLAGFSQGGAMALHTGLRYSQRLGGIIALSTYLPMAGLLDQEAHSANADVPILMMHGQYDEIIPCLAALHSKSRLEQAGYAVQWHDFPIQHAVCQEQLPLISNWILQRLSL